MNKEEKLSIIGAGLTGSLLAIYLLREGHEVELFEKRPDLRVADMSAGRSINLALSSRGLKALEEVGLKETVLQYSIPMMGREIHALDGTTTFIPYGRNPEEHLWALSRKKLNCLLLDALQEFSDGTIHFSSPIESINWEEKTLQTRGRIFPFNILLGGDGSSGVLRDAMVSQISQVKENRREELGHSYLELTMPPISTSTENPEGHAIEKERLHIWPRGDFMLIALPNPEGDFTCTLFLPNKKFKEFEESKNPPQVFSQFFKEHFPDAYDLIPYVEKFYEKNRVSSLSTLYFYPWANDAGDVLVMGDAAHAIVPFYGQGMNLCFEDCRKFHNLIKKSHQKTNWKDIFHEFQEIQKPNSDAIAQMAIDNYLEMRDLTARPEFIFQKEVENYLATHFPKKFSSQYHMVTFEPGKNYCEILKQKKKQDPILEEFALENYAYEHVNKIPHNKILTLIDKIAHL